MLAKMGWDAGQGLGKANDGIVEPVAMEVSAPARPPARPSIHLPPHVLSCLVINGPQR